MKSKLKKSKKGIFLVGTGLVGVYIGIYVPIKRKIKNKSINDNNRCMNTTTEHGNEKLKSTYVDIVKPVLDRILSLMGIIVLFPLFVVISIIIFIDDPGPVFFIQKRIGKDKHYIYIHKFRTMFLNAPHNVPTHKLENPEQYLTKVGRILRKTSLDELPQFLDIFCGQMSFIGPRPALWNQNDLIVERDKYGANDVMPGLTGLAQIKGRDELQIVDKAKLDGEYVRILNIGGIRAFLQDVKCLVGTVECVLKHDGVIEGGTGSLADSGEEFWIKRNVGLESVDLLDAGFEKYGYKKHFCIDKNVHKYVLITGADSYIGESFKAYVTAHYPNIEINTLDMKDISWKSHDFSQYDTVFHVAGIAHADMEKITPDKQKKYYAVNTDLAIKTAEHAKAEGIRQFIFMSSMIVYGERQHIDEYTVPAPSNFYGDSKWQADKGIRELESDDFNVAVLRSPMIYGKGSKGNYSILEKLARKLPIFPDVDNQRSMLYIENLCEFVAQLICSGEGGIYFPQNREYTKTSEMFKLIGEQAQRQIKITKLLNPIIGVVSHISGRMGKVVKKAFGDFTYDYKLSLYDGLNYQKVDFIESIKRIEKVSKKSEKKCIVIISSQYFWLPEEAGPTRFYSIAKMFQENGYEVTVITSSFEHHEKVQRNKNLYSPFHMIYIDCPAYKRNIDPRREISNIIFMLRIKRILKENKDLFDIVYCSLPPNNISAAIGRFCSKNHIPFIVDIEDLWPEAMRIILNKPFISNVLFYPYKRDAERTYKYANAVVGTSEEYSLRASKHNGRTIPYKTVYVGCDVETFDREVKENFNMIKKPDNEIWVTYAGTIGHSYAIDNLIRAAKLLQNKGRKYIKFKLLGSGPLESEVKQLAVSIGCKNVDFLGYVPHPIMAVYLAKSDILVNSFGKGASQSIVNKVGDYLAAAMPMINTLENKEFCDLVKKYEVGVNVPAENAARLSEAIIKLSIACSDREMMGKNARKLALERFNRKKSYLEIVRLADSVLEENIRC